MKKLLIIAESAQMLAQAAHNIGLKTVVIDGSIGSDTQALATQYYQVKSLTQQAIKPIVALLKNQVSTCIYGSGFETSPDSLFFLEKHFQLLGNSSQVFKALQNKPQFFQQLQQLDIAFPKVFFNPEHIPVHKDKKAINYLIKPFNSIGGYNIQHAKVADINKLKHSQYYYQHYINGESMSVLFVANGQQATIIGFNKQWTNPSSFIFVGIINHAKLSITHQQTLRDWTQKLTVHYALLGLCSLDFILYKDKCYLLEINPRPSASMRLYGKNLLKMHYLACQGQLEPSLISNNKTYTAYQIVYAIIKIKIPLNMKWPQYCCSLPQAETIIDKGNPLCSLIVSGKNPKTLREDLQQKQHSLFTQLSETT